jgi:hypothetical protein
MTTIICGAAQSELNVGNNGGKNFRISTKSSAVITKWLPPTIEQWNDACLQTIEREREREREGGSFPTGVTKRDDCNVYRSEDSKASVGGKDVRQTRREESERDAAFLKEDAIENDTKTNENDD